MGRTGPPETTQLILLDSDAFSEVISTKPHREEGLPGIISCFAFSPLSSPSRFYAAGSYLGGVGLWDASTHELRCLMEGHRGGVTSTVFAPNGTLLFTSARKDEWIFAWDVRKTVTEVFRMGRVATTHQRIAIEVDSTGRWLVTGGTDGVVRMFDVDRDGEECARMQASLGGSIGGTGRVDRRR